VSFDPQPLPQSYTNTTSPSLNIWVSEQRRLKPPARKESTSLQESQSIADVVTSTKTPDVLPIQKINRVSMFLNSLTQTDKPKTSQFIASVIKPQMDYEEFNNAESFEHLFMAEPENAELTIQFDVEEYKEHQENPNQETPIDFPKSDIKRYFTFNDVPPSKWRKRSIKMLNWCTAELQISLKRSISGFRSKNVTIAQTTLGELYQLILNALAKLNNQKKFFVEFERTGKHVGTACDDRYLQIKCKDKSSCDCTHIKKKFHSKRFSSLSGHFTRNCPDKKRSQALIQALNQVELVVISDLESLYSLDDEPSDSVLCTIAYSDLSSDDDSDTDSLEGDSDFGVYMINPIPHVLPIQKDPPLPLAKIYLLTDAYAKPILVIAFFDTGSSVSILNHNILPDHYWKPHHQNFMAANGEKFVIDKISVPINIRLFPKCVIKRRLLADDKFPLLQKKSLFQHLADARVLSKFDLKSGFCQLGIKPEDRPKTAFCIPDHHYQWKVMPFGLKNALSAFQKAMITIFEPILANTLVYIDDIFLFSPDEQSHAELLSKFYSLVTKCEIMLTEKKMEVGVTIIQFL
nr:RNA-directed DNA polymerase homolog [Tanacetum cinerariifolium]